MGRGVRELEARNETVAKKRNALYAYGALAQTVFLQISARMRVYENT